MKFWVQYNAQILTIIGAALLALLFDASSLVWVLAVAALVLTIGYEVTRRLELTEKFPTLRTALFSFAAWEWISLAYGCSALQLMPVWSVALITTIVCIGFIFLFEKDFTTRIVFGALWTIWCLVLLFGSASFFGRGALAAAAFAFLATLVHGITAGNSTKRLIITASIFVIVIVFCVSLFSWFL